MNRFSNQRTEYGNYRKLRSIQSNTSAFPLRNSFSEFQDRKSNQTTQQNPFLEQLRWEWQQNNLSTDSLVRIQGIMNVLESEESRASAKRMKKRLSKVIKKLPIKEVVNAMSKELNLGDLLKGLGENGSSSDMLQNMMNNPEMKQTAMDMMQEMMSDEKKMAEMTEMMAKMLNPDKK